MRIYPEKPETGGESPLKVLDMELEPGSSVEIESGDRESGFVYLLEGEAFAAGRSVAQKTVILFSAGEKVELMAGDAPVRLLICGMSPQGGDVEFEAQSEEEPTDQPEQPMVAEPED